MTLDQYIEQNRDSIDEAIKRVKCNIETFTDQDRKLWLTDRKKFYFLANN